MESIGQTLRQAREAQRVTLEDIARITKIKYEILQKIESDEFEALVSPTYTRGFIKLYADHLGLNGQVVADAYIASQGGLRRRGLHVETVGTTRKRELSLPVRRVVMLVAGLTVLAIAVVVITSILPESSRTEPVAPSATLPAVDFDAYYQPRTKPAPPTLEGP